MVWSLSVMLALLNSNWWIQLIQSSHEVADAHVHRPQVVDCRDHSEALGVQACKFSELQISRIVIIRGIVPEVCTGRESRSRQPQSVDRALRTYCTMRDRHECSYM